MITTIIKYNYSLSILFTQFHCRILMFEHKIGDTQNCNSKSGVVTEMTDMIKVVRNALQMHGFTCKNEWILVHL